MTNEYLQLGAIGILFLLSIREFFGYLKNKKQSDNGSTGKAILEELKSQNENHLHTIEGGMNEGFNRMVDCYNQKSDKIIELLARIEGRLSK